MSDRIAQILAHDDRKEIKYVEYALMAFVTLVLFKFLTESMSAKKNRQMQSNKLLFEARRLSLMAQMRRAASDGRGGGGGGGGGGSNKQ